MCQNRGLGPSLRKTLDCPDPSINQLKSPGDQVILIKTQLPQRATNYRICPEFPSLSEPRDMLREGDCQPGNQ